MAADLINIRMSREARHLLFLISNGSDCDTLPLRKKELTNA